MYSSAETSSVAPDTESHNTKFLVRTWAGLHAGAEKGVPTRAQSIEKRCRRRQKNGKMAPQAPKIENMAPQAPNFLKNDLLKSGKIPESRGPGWAGPGPGANATNDYYFFGCQIRCY